MVTTREITFNLEGTLSSMGLPINGVRVRLFDYWNVQGVLSKHYLCEELSKNRGTFNFTVRKGIYSIEFLPNENTRFARQSIETIHVTGPKSFTVSMKPGAIFSGQALDHLGSPLSGAELLLFAIEPHVLKTSVVLDGNGEFNITVPAGRYYLALRHLASGEDNAIPFVCPVFEVIEFKNDYQHDIKLPQLHQFSGRVLDTNNNPVAGVEAKITARDKVENIFAQDVPLAVTSTTDADGRFTCLLQKGEYNVRLIPAETSVLAEKCFGPFLVDKNKAEEFILEKGFELKGKVEHAGKAIHKAIVNLSGPKLQSCRETKDDGSFRFCLGQAEYELTVITPPDSLNTASEIDLAPTVRNITLSSTNVELSVELEEGVLVTGVVQDAKGKPCPGVQLSLYTTNNGGFDAKANKQALWVGITGDDGSYEFRLMPDSYWLVLNNQASTGHLVDVTGSPDTEGVKISDVCMVQIEVVSDTDEAIANVQVSAQPYERSASDQATPSPVSTLPLFTNNKGQCTLALPAGIYSLNFYPPEHSSHKPRNLRQLSVGSDMHKKVKLESKT
jgi:hypothetical protein